MEQGPSHRVSEVKRALKVISSLSLAVLESLSLSSLAARSTASPSLGSAGHPESSCPVLGASFVAPRSSLGFGSRGPPHVLSITVPNCSVSASSSAKHIMSAG